MISKEREEQAVARRTYAVARRGSVRRLLVPRFEGGSGATWRRRRRRRRMGEREFWTWRWTPAWPASVLVVVFVHGRCRRAPRAEVETDKVAAWALGIWPWKAFGRRVDLLVLGLTIIFVRA
jgi:hypothetical protein